MGVPKFYRWISERYPCLNEMVKEFQLPEFDNLYLDMNGIIHNCSHPDDDSPHFRITEEQIFTDICRYTEFLFRMIKPKKVFFMAVDGVAPRAKMNQQRGRRFKAAKEAEEVMKKAMHAGEKLPTEKMFDSNCITPGTTFMVRLQEHLKYFVNYKISNDPLWQGVSVLLSGQETPGEGEHKILDYIRWAKSQPFYDGNTRHCLYGLDADLMILGLATHERHFSLLREKVLFHKKKARPASAEETTFYLLHLSLMRDYVGHEFSSVKDKLPFEWDLERLIDDWILMSFLVGNDFVPHLPHFHIKDDVLPLLWQVYMNVLPTLGGYINDGGHLNLQRLEKYFDELAEQDPPGGLEVPIDKQVKVKKKKKEKNNIIPETHPANAIPNIMWRPMFAPDYGGTRPLDYVEVEDIYAYTKEYDRLQQVYMIQQPGEKIALCEGVNHVHEGNHMEEGNHVEEEVHLEGGKDLEEDIHFQNGEAGQRVENAFLQHKKDYYLNKLCLTSITRKDIGVVVEYYVQAIQWITLYYFEGVPSWSWYYPYHYSPFISDIRQIKNMKIEFDLSTPFLPFQQLMAVLPSASKELLPHPFQPLMTDPGSPVIHFYPVDFASDLNGKQPWEAVILIPFIDEKKLLSAMKPRISFLTKEERARNEHGPHLLYAYTSKDLGFYPSTLPGTCLDIYSNRAEHIEIDQNFFRIESRLLKKGVTDNVDLNVYYPGFPTLRHIPHTHELRKLKLMMFGQNSRGSSMLLQIETKPDIRLEELADEILGKTVYVGWPYLHEARVTSVANKSFRIGLPEETERSDAAVGFNHKILGELESAIVESDAKAIKIRYMAVYAIDVGNIDTVVYASPLTGRTYAYGKTGTISLDKQFASQPLPFAYQHIVQDLQVKQRAYTTLQTLRGVFPKYATVFMLGTLYYGAKGRVLEVLPEEAKVRVCLEVPLEPELQQLGLLKMEDRYMSEAEASKTIGISTQLMSRLTGSVFLKMKKGKSKRSATGQQFNVGLNLKPMTVPQIKVVPNYTRREADAWMYSEKCVAAVRVYVHKFPTLCQLLDTAKKVPDKCKDVFKEEDLFPEDGSYTVSEVTEFIDSLPCSKAQKTKPGLEILQDELVAEIEALTAKISGKSVTFQMEVIPRLLYRPLTDLGSNVPHPNTDFLLYDRIVVVKAGYSVPFGKRGTIIGIPMEEGVELSPHSVYDVVFDEAFPGGITLRCSPGKGCRVPGSAMLNITYGEFRKDRPVSERPTAVVCNKGRTSIPQNTSLSLPTLMHSPNEPVTVFKEEEKQPSPGTSNKSDGFHQAKLGDGGTQQPIQVQVFAGNREKDMKSSESSSQDSNTSLSGIKPQTKQSEIPALMELNPFNIKAEPVRIKRSELQASERQLTTRPSQSAPLPLALSLFANPDKMAAARSKTVKETVPETVPEVVPMSREDVEFMTLFNYVNLLNKEDQLMFPSQTEDQQRSEPSKSKRKNPSNSKKNKIAAYRRRQSRKNSNCE